MDTPNGPPGAASTPADSARRIKESADSAMESGKQAAKATVEQGVRRASGSAQSAASALRRAADDVAPENAWIGGVLRKSADGIERASHSFDGGDFTRAIEDLHGFARRQPALFLGASLALGFALARVGKAAVERAGDSDADSEYSPMPGL